MDKEVKQERTTLNLIAVLVAIALPTLVTFIYFKWLNGYDSWVQQSAYGIGKFIQFAIPVVWVWFFFRYRFNREHRQRNVELASTKEDSMFSKFPNWLWAVGFGIDVCIIMGLSLIHI